MLLNNYHDSLTDSSPASTISSTLLSTPKDLSPIHSNFSSFDQDLHITDTSLQMYSPMNSRFISQHQQTPPRSLQLPSSTRFVPLSHQSPTWENDVFMASPDHQVGRGLKPCSTDYNAIRPLTLPTAASPSSPQSPYFFSTGGRGGYRGLSGSPSHQATLQGGGNSYDSHQNNYPAPPQNARLPSPSQYGSESAYPFPVRYPPTELSPRGPVPFRGDTQSALRLGHDNGSPHRNQREREHGAETTWSPSNCQVMQRQSRTQRDAHHFENAYQPVSEWLIADNDVLQLPGFGPRLAPAFPIIGTQDRGPHAEFSPLALHQLSRKKSHEVSRFYTIFRALITLNSTTAD